jgi:hypothetical protein
MKKVFEYTTVTNSKPRFIIAENEGGVKNFFHADSVDYIKERTDFNERDKKGIFEL